MPAAIVNPLRRQQRISPNDLDLKAKYSRVLNYDGESRPPLISRFCIFTLPPVHFSRLRAFCKETGASVGSGIFALVALSMMHFYEEENPEISDGVRPHFVASFPLDPRALFGYDKPHDSCMLAFSEGISFPFLRRDLDFEGRFRLLTRIANRQLKQYQKRVKQNSGNSGSAVLSTSGLMGNSAARIIANNYIFALERRDFRVSTSQDAILSPQGELRCQPKLTPATCGISSIGSKISDLYPGFHCLDSQSLEDDMNTFRADVCSVNLGVRARDDEFLIGCSSNTRGIHFTVSYDASSIDDEKVERWKNWLLQVLAQRNDGRANL
jgi:hypothetical protein